MLRLILAHETPAFIQQSRDSGATGTKSGDNKSKLLSAYESEWTPLGLKE